ncbi:hypothetical protein RB25_05935 [Herbaspirillum rubrisubalbicans]|uniref:Heme exporter protein D n=2 Tax=Herbaspirillum rubrisubalbicans TaxID=80842 RepID=A0ABX9BXW5_9BURK|nr:hypothetical protein [Herbaspirillum rubrisubalbicans]MCP1572397.1 hypothetical protein [Herbaspirillum rubrisubalbicans]QJQ01025.1 hypothetical protein C798_12500 [Herbaspirillum rubrisubalbicans Os34]RAM62800.1 hypothetical protein RB24_19405 [Herbaspirillum rubrisubalbicans]RAN49312.1 hypothetical protein RB25_05935 [Herbaspirillum rubrisubalbicans]
MAIVPTLLHYASYLAAFYALYLLAGALGFGLFVWQSVYHKAARQPVRVKVRNEHAQAHERDTYHR